MTTYQMTTVQITMYLVVRIEIDQQWTGVVCWDRSNVWIEVWMNLADRLHSRMIKNKI